MPTQSKRLGKGLGALLGESAVVAARAEADAAGSGVLQVPIARIRPNRHQPRRTFDEDAIADLAASIAQKGVLQPLIVTPAEGGVTSSSRGSGGCGRRGRWASRRSRSSSGRWTSGSSSRSR